MGGTCRGLLKGKTLEASLSLRKCSQLLVSWHQMQMYKQAAHCYEELLLLAPTQLTHHLRYADTLYTLGTAQDISTAQTYYAHVLRSSQGTNLRALYGICSCVSHPKARRVRSAMVLGVADECVQSGGADESPIGKLSAKALIKLYTDADSPLLPYIRSILQSQELID